MHIMNMDFVEIWTVSATGVVVYALLVESDKFKHKLLGITGFIVMVGVPFGRVWGWW